MKAHTDERLTHSNSGFKLSPKEVDFLISVGFMTIATVVSCDSLLFARQAEVLNKRASK